MTAGKVAAVVASAVWPPELPAFASKLAVFSVAPVADEGAWLPTVSAVLQTAYAQEGLAALACQRNNLHA